jgi:hypothetical protein
MAYELWITKKPEQRHTNPKAKPVMRFTIELERTSRVSSLLDYIIDIDSEAKAWKINKYYNICVVDTDINIVVIGKILEHRQVILGDSLAIKWRIDFPFVEEKWLRNVCKSKLVDVEEGDTNGT